MTDTPITTEELDEMQARADKCTGGPWGWEHEADRPFLKHAPADIPRLIAEVRRLRKPRKPNTSWLDEHLLAKAAEAITKTQERLGRPRREIP